MPDSEMDSTKNTTLRFHKTLNAKFLAVVALAAIVFSVFVLLRSYSKINAETDKLLSSQSEMALNFAVAVRKYVTETVRPFACAHLDPNEFVPEIMSSSYVARTVFRDVQQKFPDYLIRLASEHPRNPANQATEAEAKIIRYFNENRDVDSWQGEVTINGRPYLAHFHAIRMESGCLKCHGEPADAPKALVEHYGDQNGFHRNVGSVIAVDTVAIPSGPYRKAALHQTFANFFVLSTGLCLLLAAVYWAFHTFVSRKLNLISDHFRHAAVETDASLIEPIECDSSDEIGAVVSSFNILAGRFRLLYESLEHRVEVRTHELRLANKALKMQIVERKHAEEEITKIARFPDENPYPVLRVASEGVVLYGNSASAPLLKMWNCSAGGKLPRNWARYAEMALEHNARKMVEVECDDKIFALTFTPIPDLGYVNCYGLDITDRRRAEEQLTETLSDLKRHNQLMAGREDRVLELKKLVNNLHVELGMEPRYKITADESPRIEVIEPRLPVDEPVSGQSLPPAAEFDIDAEAAERNGLEQRSVEIGFIPILCSAPLLYAHSRGFFARSGLDVRLTPAPGWSGIRDLMVHGKMDAAHMLAPMPLASTLGIDGRRTDITLAAVQNVNGQALTLAKRYAEIKDLREMKGCTFAVPYRFSMHYYLLCYLLARHGLDPLKDVTIKEVSPPRMPYHLAQGWVDGIFAPQPYDQIPVNQGTGFIHTLSKHIWQGHPCCCFAAKTQFKLNCPNTYKTLLDAVIRAELELHNADPEKRREIASQIAGPAYLNQPFVQPIRDALSGRFPDGRGKTHNVADRIDFIPHPWPDYGKWMLSQMQRWGQLPGKVDYNQIVESTFDGDTIELAEAIGFEKGLKPSLGAIAPFAECDPFDYMKQQPFNAYIENAEQLPAHNLPESARTRLDTIVSRLAQIAAGRQTEPLDVTSSDEIGQLEQVLKDTIENLEFTKQALLEQKHVLETNVELRTEELKRSEKIALSMMEDANRAQQQSEKSRAQIECINLKLQDSIERANQLASEATVANKAKSEFLANMSHEIRTPLNAIIGFSQVLAEQEMTSEQKEYVGIIHDSGESLLRLISDILDFSKIEAGRLDTEFISFSLPRVLNTVESIVKPKADKKNLEFAVATCPDLPAQIITDPTRLRQCLINLVHNAIKFTEQGHVYVNVSLETVDDDPFIRFDVEDTGLGIPADRQDAIFEAFTQADGSTTRKFGGTGLGLTITRKLAELLGGSLTVSSEEGKGSVFSLTVPAGLSMDDLNQARQSGDQTSAGSTVESDETPQLSANILVAEDTATNQMLIKLLLDKTGVDVSIVDDGQKAIEAALEGHFDLIFMDIQMPNMNGYEATAILRQKGLNLPVVALTAHAMKGDDARCMEAGCTDYLSKPIDRSRLYAILRKYLGHLLMPETGDDESQSQPAETRNTDSSAQ